MANMRQYIRINIRKILSIKTRFNEILHENTDPSIAVNRLQSFATKTLITIYTSDEYEHHVNHPKRVAIGIISQVIILITTTKFAISALNKKYTLLGHVFCDWTYLLGNRHLISGVFCL